MTWSRLSRRLGGFGPSHDVIRYRKPQLETLELRQVFSIDPLAAALVGDLDHETPLALPLAASEANIQDTWISQGTTSLSVSEETGEKPQSKVWSYGGDWFAVLPNSSGTWVWRLDGSNWTQLLKLSSNDSVQADVKTVGAVAHLLLFDGSSTQLASIQYNAATRGYGFWTERPANVNISLPSSTETATIDVDSTGRMWLCYENKSSRTVEVRYSDGNYASWSAAITVASGINSDDIAAVIAMPTGQIGVFWSNQNTSTFGFRTHDDGAAPTSWSAAEVAAPQSQSSRMADDHLHLAVTVDGTLYVAAKTSYDKSGSPEIILLVRRPNGNWDPMYAVAGTGTRPVIALSEVHNRLLIAYTERDGGGKILYRESPLDVISFGASRTLIGGNNNNVTTSKANFTNSILFLAGTGSRVTGTLLSNPAPSEPAPLNAPPVVAAGADRVAQLGTPLPLVGAISDDGLPGHDLTAQWSLVSGPGAAYFGNATQPATNVIFSNTGVYVLRLTASDGEHTVSDEIVVNVGPAGSAAPEIAGFWNFKSGIGAAYSSIIGHLGTFQDGASVNAQGRLALAGDGGHYTVDNVSQLQISEAITIAAWIKPAVRAAQDIVSKAGTDEVDGFELGLSGDGKIFVRFNQATSGESFRLESIADYPTTGTAWMHVAATYDGATIRLYINGLLQASLDAELNIALNELPLTFGSDHNGLRAMRGELDEVLLTGRALSSGEISQVYFGTFNPAATANQPPTVSAGPNRSAEAGAIITLIGSASDDGRPTGSLDVQWSVVSGPGSVTFGNAHAAETVASFSVAGSYTLRLTASDGALSASDEMIVVVSSSTAPPADMVGFWNFMPGRGASYPSLLGNTGSLQGGASISDDGRLQLSASGQYYSVPNASQLAISQAITLTAWIKPAAGGAQTILSKAGAGADGFELGLSASGKVFVRFNQASSANAYRVESTVNFPTSGNQWMHVAVTYDGSTIRLFINGQLDASKAAVFSIGTNSLPLVIGATPSGTSSFRGQLDEVLVAGRALTAAEITQVHFGSFDPYHAPTGNQPPTVDAGGDRSVPAGTALSLAGSVTDDGLPSGVVLSQWSVVSGPGEVSFANTADPQSAATFLVEGTYVLRLTASDGALTSSDEITVTVTAAASPSILGFWNFHPDFGGRYPSAIGGSGSLVGGATVSSDGRLNLNGPGQYYTVPNRPELAIAQEITITAWIKPAASGAQTIVSKAGNGSDGFEFALSAEGKIFVRFNAGSAGDTFRVDSTTSYPTTGNNWMHVAATYDGTTIRLYVNGNLEGSKNASFTIGTNSLPLNFGAGQGGANAFRGQLDEVLVDARALTSAEIKQLHFGTFRPEAPPPAASVSGVVGRWDFSTTDDGSGQGNGGTLTGGATLGAGRTGSGLRLNGSNQRMLVEDSPSLDITEQITLAAWIQPSTRATQYVIKKATQGSVDGYEIGLSSSGKVFVRFNQDSSGDSLRVDSTSSYPTNGSTWMHVVATYDGTTIRLYINGQLQASKAAAFTIATNDLDLSIGAQPNGGSSMRGTIDDVLIANRAFTAEEILSLYQGS